MFEDFLDNGTRERRARALMAAVVLLFGVLGVRLYLLQISDWERYRIQSEQNTMEPSSIEASRGLIRDRNGVILVDNRPSYTVSVIPPRLRGIPDPELRKRVKQRLSQLISVPMSVVEKRLSSKKGHFYEPIKLRQDVGFETVSVIEENRYDMPGVEVQVEARRGYTTFGRSFPIAPHVLGYVGLIDERRYQQMRPLGYRLDDQIGKRGVERLGEPRLRGQDGVKYIEVDARGREVGSFPTRTQSPTPGEDLYLTLDYRLQLEAEMAFGDSLRGSLVVMDPRSGEILAMVSAPGFHPRSIRNSKEWAALNADPAKPLLNRTMQGEYPPGSVYKMVTAIAALEMGILDPNEPRYTPCEGQLQMPDRVFRCHLEKGHGTLNLRGALVHSCDIFFYHLGREVGIRNWNRYSRILGFGSPTGIDLANGGDGEAVGLVTDRAYYEARGGKWLEGFMLNLTIGQGETSTTPIQIARYMCALATGRLPHPRVLLGNVPNEGGEPVAISEETLATIRDILRDVVEDPTGTGRRARVEGISVGGKTGTAQNSHGEDHAWFVALAPALDPEIVVVAVAENAGQGGEIAAPIVQKVLETYFYIVAPDRRKSLKMAVEKEEGKTMVAAKEEAGEVRKR